MKFKQGWIMNNETGEKVWIYAKSALPAHVKDLIIGGTAILAGIAYIAWKSFDHGAHRYEMGEFEVLEKMGLISANKDDVKIQTPATHFSPNK